MGAEHLQTEAAPASAKQKQPMKKGVLAALIAGGVALLLAVAFLATAVLTLRGDEIYSGIFAGDVELGGATREEALEMLKRVYTGSAAKGDLNILVGSTTYTIPAKDCPVSYDLEQAVEDAYAYGREGMVVSRLRKVWGARRKGYNIGLPIQLDETLLREKTDGVVNTAAQSLHKSGFVYENQVLTVDPGQPGYNADGEVLFADVKARVLAGDYTPVQAKLEEILPDPLDWDAIAKAVNSEVREPSLDLAADPSGNTLLPGRPGVTLDVDKAKAQVAGASGPVVIDLAIVKPSITDAQYQALLFRDVLGSGSSKFNASNVPRTSNVALAAKFCNGTILNPGDVFSYNGIVGPRTAERGFKEASVYVGDKVEDGLGGGICQVSSTIYLATLYSDLKVVERYNHSREATYMPTGQDATVSYGSKNYRFQNDTKYPIKVVTKISGNRLTVTIYGTQTTPGKSVKVVTDILSKTPYQTIYKTDTSLPAGTTKVQSSGYTGYKTQTYRVVYVNGKEVSRTKEAYSSYAKYDKIVLQNPKPVTQPEPTPQPPEPTTPEDQTPTVPENGGSNPTPAQNN